MWFLFPLAGLFQRWHHEMIHEMILDLGALVEVNQTMLYGVNFISKRGVIPLSNVSRLSPVVVHNSYTGQESYGSINRHADLVSPWSIFIVTLSHGVNRQS